MTSFWLLALFATTSQLLWSHIHVHVEATEAAVFVVLRIWFLQLEVKQHQFFTVPYQSNTKYSKMKDDFGWPRLLQKIFIDTSQIFCWWAGFASQISKGSFKFKVDVEHSVWNRLACFFTKRKLTTLVIFKLCILYCAVATICLKSWCQREC